jgi:hypothetical protein
VLPRPPMSDVPDLAQERERVRELTELVRQEQRKVSVPLHKPVSGRI